ncbi:MAG: hypothetical protein KAJ10_15410 [Thermodesulfovibrionia bacterium]|nr:hypothetical protein [Thermodesulfovibrionia bacterium]
MANVRLFLVLFVITLFIPLHSCSDSDGNQPETVFRELPEIKEIRPQRPVKIKLKRNATGSYSWELSGDNAGAIIEIDKKMRESIEK